MVNCQLRIVNEKGCRGGPPCLPGLNWSVIFMNTISYNQNEIIVNPGKDAPAYSEDGVDLTLIRWALSLTPTERLKVLQDSIISVFRLRTCGNPNQKS
jgi:hypothetical protein